MNLGNKAEEKSALVKATAITHIFRYVFMPFRDIFFSNQVQRQSSLILVRCALSLARNAEGAYSSAHGPKSSVRAKPSGSAMSAHDQNFF